MPEKSVSVGERERERESRREKEINKITVLQYTIVHTEIRIEHDFKCFLVNMNSLNERIPYIH